MTIDERIIKFGFDFMTKVKVAESLNDIDLGGLNQLEMIQLENLLSTDTSKIITLHC